MDNIVPYITFALTLLLGIISFFLKRELDNAEKAVNKLEAKVDAIDLRVQRNEISQEKLTGKLDLILELLERVEKKVENINV